jgi:Zn-dependent peptidase ImmA (M78 family)
VFQPRLTEWFAACGVAVAFVPELPKIRASGATRWLTPSKALIQVNLRYKTDDHFWFTVFHEAWHVLNDSKKMLFVDTERFDGEHEEAANRFAAEQLVPQVELTALAFSRRHLSKADIVAFARRQGIAPGIVVGQLQHRRLLPFAHCNELKRTFVWA